MTMRTIVTMDEMINILVLQHSHHIIAHNANHIASNILHIHSSAMLGDVYAKG
jgi:hypothetical protein